MRGYILSMLAVRVRALRWVADEPQPGWTSADLQALAGLASTARERLLASASEDVRLEYDRLQDGLSRWAEEEENILTAARQRDKE